MCLYTIIGCHQSYRDMSDAISSILDHHIVVEQRVALILELSLAIVAIGLLFRVLKRP